MTTFRNRVELLPEMVDRIVRRFDPEQIILFGSHARGDARPDSDIDLLVIMETDDRLRSMLDVGAALADGGLFNDVVVQTPQAYERRRGLVGTVERIASKEGRILYARG